MFEGSSHRLTWVERVTPCAPLWCQADSIIESVNTPDTSVLFGNQGYARGALGETRPTLSVLARRAGTEASVFADLRPGQPDEAGDEDGSKAAAHD